jgi:hypothetical protein
MPSYQYTPLDIETGEIRLVELHPGALDSLIQISILTTPFVVPPPDPPQADRLLQIRESLPVGWSVFENLEGRFLFWDNETYYSTWEHPDANYSLDETNCQNLKAPAALCSPPFEALSYVWGEANHESTIDIIPSLHWSTASDPTHQEQRTKLIIRQNLYEALKHLRNPDAARFLWIDAISINQDNMTERSQQISRMGDIYKYAQRVVVWLGLASTDSTLALHVLGLIGDQVEFSKKHRSARAPGCRYKDWYLTTNAADLDSDPKTWLAVYNLLLRPWFYRLWVIQEIQLANSSAVLQCGKDIVEWRQLRRAVCLCTCMKTFPLASPQGLSSLLQDSYGFAVDSRSQNVLYMMRDATHARCSDPRDKVFALLGLLPQSISQIIQPSYTKSPREVHRESFVAYVKCSGKLDILALLGPSWIPDWSVPTNFYDLEHMFCSGNSSAEVSYTTSDVLIATGIEYDTIEEVAGKLSDSGDENLGELRRVWMTETSHSQTYPTGETLAEACAWVINTGCLIERQQQHLFCTTLSEAQRPFLRSVDVGYQKSTPISTRFVNGYSVGGFPFRTTKGYFGLCIQEPLPGDKVCVLLGCYMPTILRTSPDGNHLFIGCAYVYGMMDGEVLLGPLPQDTRIIIRPDHNGDMKQLFLEPSNSASLLDPRLGPLPAHWEAITAPDRLWPQKRVDAFRNRITGEVIHSDPRLFPDALRARGVQLEKFALM